MDNFAFIPAVVKICYLSVMSTDYVFYIIYAIVTNFELLWLKILWYLWFITKCLSNKYYITFNIFTNIGPGNIGNIFILLTFHFLLIF